MIKSQHIEVWRDRNSASFPSKPCAFDYKPLSASDSGSVSDHTEVTCEWTPTISGLATSRCWVNFYLGCYFEQRWPIRCGVYKWAIYFLSTTMRMHQMSMRYCVVYIHEVVSQVWLMSFAARRRPLQNAHSSSLNRENVPRRVAQYILSVTAIIRLRIPCMGRRIIQNRTTWANPWTLML